MGAKEDSSIGEKAGNENDEDDSYFNLKRPESWSECRSIIWNKSEERILKMQNPDGLLYLSYLKYCGQLFSLFTFFSIVLLIPLYTTFKNPSIFTPLKDNWNFSRLDKLTLAASIDDNDTVRIIILLTYTYSLFAYYLLFQFCT